MKFGLIGYPLSHSFSQKYFTLKFQKHNLPHSYQNFEISGSQLPEFIRNNNLDGFNVTIPYKEKIIPLLDFISEDAKEIGAVNCVKIIKQNNKRYLKGFNTDWIGFSVSLQKILFAPNNKALILGYGGAAKAVAFALKKMQIPFTVVSRNNNGLSYQEITKNVIIEHTIIINTTPLGMFPDIQKSPPIPYQYLNSQHIMYDLIYNPAETLFLQQGKKQRCIVKNGLEMLEIQAEESFKIWTDENIH
jgi:shikimate dehydrogenase